VRRVVGVSEITGMEGTTPLLQEIFRFQRSGRQGKRIVGEFVATGVIPRLVERMRERNEILPMTWFTKAGGGGPGHA
jgi:pilus assembly protein CpaF